MNQRDPAYRCDVVLGEVSLSRSKIRFSEGRALSNVYFVRKCESEIRARSVHKDFDLEKIRRYEQVCSSYCNAKNGVFGAFSLSQTQRYASIEN